MGQLVERIGRSLSEQHFTGIVSLERTPGELLVESSVQAQAPAQLDVWEAGQNVVIYLRSASAGQGGEDGAILAQREAVQQWAVGRGHAVLEAFQDVGVSAHTSPAARPGFVAMLTYCKENPVQLVLVSSRDRIVRSHLDYGVWASLLRKYGVAIRSISEEPGPGALRLELPDTDSATSSINFSAPTLTNGRNS